jgi:hypothetical protein
MCVIAFLQSAWRSPHCEPVYRIRVQVITLLNIGTNNVISERHPSLSMDEARRVLEAALPNHTCVGAVLSLCCLSNAFSLRGVSCVFAVALWCRCFCALRSR